MIKYPKIIFSPWSQPPPEFLFVFFSFVKLPATTDAMLAFLSFERNKNIGGRNLPLQWKL